jgi:hypothetical protein
MLLAIRSGRARKARKKGGIEQSYWLSYELTAIENNSGAPEEVVKDPKAKFGVPVVCEAVTIPIDVSGATFSS